jgi:hypothetical protein
LDERRLELYISPDVKIQAVEKFGYFQPEELMKTMGWKPKNHVFNSPTGDVYNKKKKNPDLVAQTV